MSIVNCHQRGVSLIITFLIATAIITIVFGIATIVVNEIKTVGDAGDSATAFYFADTGVEKTLYYNNKQAPPGGLCGMCATCPDCINCTVTPPDPAGCDLSYETNFNGWKYLVSAKLHANLANPLDFILNIKSKGYYRDVTVTEEYGTIVKSQ